jgi:hypothetical protein
MLTEAQTAPLRGFITDLEFASIESLTFSKPQRTVTINVGAKNKYEDQEHVYSRTEPMTSMLPTFQSTVTVKRGAGITVSYLFYRSFLLFILRAPHRELFNSWPGVSYCTELISPCNLSCTKLPTTSNPLSGCSPTPSCGISTIGLSNDLRRRSFRMSGLPFETFLLTPLAKQLLGILLLRGIVEPLAWFFHEIGVSTK